MAVGDIVEVAIKGICASQEVMNILHFTRGTSGATLEDLITHIEVGSELKAAILDYMCNDYALQSIVATEITPGTPGVLHTTPPGLDTRGAQVVHTYSTSNTGHTGTAGYTGQAGVITLYSGTSGRRHRGRNYWGPTSKERYVDGALDTDGLSNLNEIAAALRWFTPDGSGDGDWLLCVYSFFYKITTTVIDTLARGLLRSQRRRNVGIGA